MVFFGFVLNTDLHQSVIYESCQSLLNLLFIVYIFNLLMYNSINYNNINTIILLYYCYYNNINYNNIVLIFRSKYRVSFFCENKILVQHYIYGFEIRHYLFFTDKLRVLKIVSK